MANKTTKVETIQSIIDKYGVEGSDKDFLLHEIDLINKRNAYKSDKPTKAQKENIVRKDGIVAAMEADKAYTATDVANLMTTDTEKWSAQRASSLLKQLKENGLVVSATHKRRTYFALAGTDIEAVLTPPTESEAE